MVQVLLVSSLTVSIHTHIHTVHKCLALSLKLFSDMTSGGCLSYMENAAADSLFSKQKSPEKLNYVHTYSPCGEGPEDL